MNQDKPNRLEWFRVGDGNMLEIGRITTVQIGQTTICLTRTEDGYGAINNRCPQPPGG